MSTTVRAVGDTSAPGASRTNGQEDRGPSTPPDTEGPKGVMPLVRRFGPSILINGVAPYFIYFVLHRQFQVAELPALLATSIPPLLDALVGIVRWRRIDFLAGFVLFTIGLAVGLVALGGDPRLYLIRESFITAGIGLAFILSNPLPRPLGFFFARYFMAGNDQARLASINDRWQRSATFRHAIRFSNVVWGLGFVLEAAVRTYLVFTLSIEQFLIASPIVFYGFYAVLLGWSVVDAANASKPCSTGLVTVQVVPLSTMRSILRRCAEGGADYRPRRTVRSASSCGRSVWITISELDSAIRHPAAVSVRHINA